MVDMNDFDALMVSGVFAISFVFFFAFFVIFIFFLLSLSKACLSIRTDEITTYVSRAWVWTQLIPLWNLVAFIVFHIKMQEASRSFEREHSLDVGHLAYPNISGWFLALSFLYIWIPFGLVLYLIMFIVFWVKIAGLSSRSFTIKAAKHQANIQNSTKL